MEDIKNYNDGEIKFIRLKTGDDIITHSYDVEKDDFDDHHMILVNPAKLLYMMSPTGQVGISLIPWVMNQVVSTQQFKVYSQDVITTADPHASLQEYYGKFVDGMKGFQMEADNDFELDDNKKMFIHDPYDDDAVDEDYDKLMDEIQSQKETAPVANTAAAKVVSDKEKDINQVINEFYKDRKKTLN